MTILHLSAAVFVGLSVATPLAYSLPIGYGYNQGAIKFHEISDDDFQVYFDARAPHDGRTALHSLQAAKPHLERWFQVKRSSPLVVNMSAESENASFANFITDSIELQTMGQGSRDLAWHEYTHAMMYLHMENWFGPAGAILHLPWMEAWFLEGLAESMSVSVGSEQQAGIERYQALQNDWPSWDRIHSLYTSGPFSYRGYATSGAFVSWILRTYDANKLATQLQTFRSDTMPWWWPWALTPFNDFWPMDTMLKQWTGLGGEALYEKYKQAATTFWSKQTALEPLSKKEDKSLRLSSAAGLVSVNGRPYALREEDSTIVLRNLTYSKDSQEPRIQINSWGSTNLKVTDSDKLYGQNIAVDGPVTLFTSDHWPASRKRRMALVLTDQKRSQTLKRKATWIQKVWLSKSDAWWLENDVENTRLCKAPRASFLTKEVKCVLATKTPSSLVALGQRDQEVGSAAAEIWIARSTQTVKGDRHEILKFDTQTAKSQIYGWMGAGRPQSVAFTQEGLWLLLSDRSSRYLRRFNEQGICQASLQFKDFPVRILNSKEQTPWLVNWLGGDYAVVSPSSLKTTSDCSNLDDHISPLLVATRSSKPLDMHQAVMAANIWGKATPDESKELSAALAGNTLDLAQSEDGTTKNETIKETVAVWRGRPVFAFPWIGADDALGPQIGIVSVPLMDHLQNETVRATVLVGVNSRFPYQELSFTEARWTPTWTLSAYRSQAYNGQYRNRQTNEVQTSYLDEKGFRLDGSLYQEWNSIDLLWSFGSRIAHTAPYIGPSFRVGNLRELYGAMGFGWRFARRWRFNLLSQNKVAPKTINEEFDYNVAGLSTSITRGIGQGSIEIGVEGERTRGSYRRDLQEVYTPLKTFIPGSGGGYNKNSYAITADQGLFAPVFGDTQGRAKLNLTHPLISDFDKFLGLVYIDRLDMSAFLNHGTAWRGDKLPEAADFITAQGYNLDLLMDNKGVRFNIGGGTGQVIGQSWQVYATAGFDALF